MMYVYAVQCREPESALTLTGPLTTIRLLERTMAEKKCTKCGTTKPLSEFNLERGKPRAYCKTCHAALALAWARSNREKRRAIANAYTKRRREALGPPKKGGGKRLYTPEQKLLKMREWRKAWNLANPEKVQEKTRRYQIARQHVPPWANFEKMHKIYAESRRLTAETGIKYEVDHIVPLQSQRVCGFHCESNLQILTKAANAAKRNHCWPDMP